jgi:hypothetical protein
MKYLPPLEEWKHPRIRNEIPLGGELKMPRARNEKYVGQK